LNLFPFTPRFIIPIAGMMVGISNYHQTWNHVIKKRLGL
jgi:hypothetical protein